MLDLFTLFTAMGLQEELEGNERRVQVFKEGTSIKDSQEIDHHAPENALEATARRLSQLYEETETFCSDLATKARNSQTSKELSRAVDFKKSSWSWYGGGLSSKTVEIRHDSP